MSELRDTLYIGGVLTFGNSMDFYQRRKHVAAYHVDNIVNNSHVCTYVLSFLDAHHL